VIYILTVCFNNLEGLQRTYSSLKSQTENNYKWVVIDGSSNDGTLEWLSTLDEPSLEYISEADTGIYDAMNKGIKQINGQADGYFIFMNSGDTFYQESTLEMVLKNNEGEAILFGDYNDVGNDNSTYLKQAKPSEHLPRGMLTSHQAIFFKLSEFDNLFHDLTYKFSGDYDYICRAFEICRLKQLPTKYLAATICNFYLDGVSVIHRKQAMKEDFFIRKNTLKLNIFYTLFLYLAHSVHLFLKTWFPKTFVKRRL